MKLIAVSVLRCQKVDLTPKIWRSLPLTPRIGVYVGKFVAEFTPATENTYKMNVLTSTTFLDLTDLSRPRSINYSLYRPKS